MPTQRTIFINKSIDSSNIGRSTHRERQKINESNREYIKARRANLSKQTTTTEHNEANLVQDASSGSLEIGSCQLSAVSGSGIKNSDATQDLIEAIPRMPSSTVDPFSSSSVPLNSTVLQILRYYVQVYHGALWGGIDAALNPTKDGRIIVRCSPEKVVLECMDKSMRMNCLLANVGTRLAITLKQSSEIESMQLIQRGTRSLREAMVEQVPNVDNEILLGALHLYLAVKASNQAEAIRAHFAGVKAILSKLRENGSTITVPCAALIAAADVTMSRSILQNISDHSEEHFSRAP